MMIPVDIWQEIKDMKQAVNDEIDNSINRTAAGEVAGLEGRTHAVSGSYKP